MTREFVWSPIQLRPYAGPNRSGSKGARVTERDLSRCAGAPRIWVGVAKRGVSGKAEVARYVEILKATRDAIKAMVDAGEPLSAVLAAKPTAAFDAEMGATDANVAAYVDRVYLSLTRAGDD